MTGRKKSFFKGLLYLSIFAVCLTGCAQNRIKITSWNLQTFFDGVTCGTEYSQFKGAKSKWNLDAYKKRLLNLCSSIEKLDADVLVMEEIENEGILYDISNELARNSFKRSKSYNYGAFYAKEKSAFGCAVISRYQINNLKVHDLDIRSEEVSQPSLRAVMELELVKGETKFTVFINHWKSKSSGEEESHKWRCWQESILARNICQLNVQDENRFWIACGDFNKEFSEFKILEDSLNEFTFPQFFDYSDKHEVLQKLYVYNPWSDFAQGKGSYYFKHKWERIDHIFLKDRSWLEEFVVEDNGPWASTNGTPLSYKVFSQEGYSDHLPVSVILNPLQ